MSDVIALVFDFDDTLASDSTTGFLESIGVDTASFWKDQVDPLLSQQDWDPVPAYLYQMIQLSRQGSHGLITRERLREWGVRLALHDGVQTLFGRLRAAVRAEHPKVQLEFYLISSGIGDVVRATPIAHEFTEIWASEFVYGEDGGISFPRRIVSFTDKTRYLFHIQKGLIGREYRNKPFEVNRKVPEDRLRVPFDQMVFVGDGYTDIPCFSLIRSAGDLPSASGIPSTATSAAGPGASSRKGACPTSTRPATTSRPSCTSGWKRPSPAWPGASR